MHHWVSMSKTFLSTTDLLQCHKIVVQTQNTLNYTNFETRIAYNGSGHRGAAVLLLGFAISG